MGENSFFLKSRFCLFFILFIVLFTNRGPRASDASSARRAGSVRGESISGMIDEGDQFPGFEGESSSFPKSPIQSPIDLICSLDLTDEAEDPSASQLPTESQVRNTELEQEAQNFLE